MADQRQAQPGAPAIEGQRRREGAPAQEGGAGVQAPPPQPRQDPPPRGAAEDPIQRLIDGMARMFNDAQVVPARRPKLKNFQGEATYPLCEFLADFDAHCRALNLPEVSRAGVMIDHLRGDPLKEIRACSAELRADATLIRQRLEAQFRRRTAVEQYAYFTRLAQKQTESLMCYARRLAPEYEAVVASCERPAEREMYAAQRDQVLKEQLASGVSALEVRREIRKLNLATPNLTYNQLRDHVLQIFGDEAAPVDEEGQDVSVNQVRATPSAPTRPTLPKKEVKVLETPRLDKLEQKVGTISKTLNEHAIVQKRLAADVKQIADGSIRRHKELLRAVDQLKGARPTAQQRNEGMREARQLAQQGAGRAPFPRTLPANRVTTDRMQDLTCYRCGERGHFARECRSERVPAVPNPTTSTTPRQSN